MHKVILIACLVGSLSVSPCRAQRLTIDLGATSGVPLTRMILPNVSFDTTSSSQQRLPAFGPTVSMTIADQVMVEVDGIFKPIHFQTVRSGGCCTISDQTRITSLEMPVLAGYRFAIRWHPYLGGGMVLYDRVWGRVDSYSIIHDQGDRQVHVVSSFAAAGLNLGIDSAALPFVIGGGFELNAGPLKLRPHLRYTHWHDARQANQWDALVGIAFPALQIGRSHTN
jgi:hypothetical protein